MDVRTWRPSRAVRLLASFGLSAAMATAAIPAQALAEGIDGTGGRAVEVTLEDVEAPEGAAIELDPQTDDSAEALVLDTEDSVDIDVESPTPTPSDKEGISPQTVEEEPGPGVEVVDTLADTAARDSSGDEPAASESPLLTELSENGPVGITTQDTATGNGFCGDNVYAQWGTRSTGNPNQPALTIYGTGAMSENRPFVGNDVNNYGQPRLLVEEGVTAIHATRGQDRQHWSKIELPSTLKMIGPEACSYADITSIVIPEGVTSIGRRAFANCPHLKSVRLPSTLKSVDAGAFDMCDALSKVVYCGSKAAWAKVKVGANNASLTSARFTYGGPAATDISRATVAAIPDQRYTGGELRPSVKLKLGGKTLQSGRDFTVAYRENVSVGRATVAITGRGSYSGTARAGFEIVASGTLGGCKWVARGGTLKISPTNGVSGTLAGWESVKDERGQCNYWPSMLGSDPVGVNRLEFAGTVSIDTAEHLFYGLNPSVIDVTHLDTGRAKSLRGLFYANTRLRSIVGLNRLSAAGVSDPLGTYDMFSGCRSVTELDLSALNPPDGWSPDLSDCVALQQVTFGPGTSNVRLPGTKWAKGSTTMTAAQLEGASPETLRGTWKRVRTSIANASVTLSSNAVTYSPFSPENKWIENVSVGGKTLSGYQQLDYFDWMRMDDGNAGTGKFVLTGKNDYAGTKTVTYEVEPRDLGYTTVSLLGKTATHDLIPFPIFTYAGGPTKPKVKVVYSESNGTGDRKYTLKANRDYTIAYKDNKAANTELENGKWSLPLKTSTAVVKGIGNFKGTVELAFLICPAKNPMAAKASTKAVKASATKQKQVVVKNAVKVSKAQGKVTYKKVSGSGKLAVNAKTGHVTVKKGTKKGTYKAKVRVSTKGNNNYLPAKKTVTCTLVVK